MKVTNAAFGCRVESVNSDVGGNPQIPLIVLHQILNKIGAQASGVVRIVFVYDKAVAVIAIQTVAGGKPHEAPSILQNGDDVTLRQSLIRGKVSEPQVTRRSVAGLGMDLCYVSGRRVSTWPSAVNGIPRNMLARRRLGSEKASTAETDCQASSHPLQHAPDAQPRNARREPWPTLRVSF